MLLYHAANFLKIASIVKQTGIRIWVFTRLYSQITDVCLYSESTVVYTHKNYEGNKPVVFFVHH